MKLGSLSGKIARLQILTIEDLFAGKKPDMPPQDPAAFKKDARDPAPAGLSHNCLRKVAGNRSRSGLKEKLTVAAYTELSHRGLITQKTGPALVAGLSCPPLAHL